MKKRERQGTDWKKILASFISGKRLVPALYKELLSQGEWVAQLVKRLTLGFRSRL